MVTNQKLQKTYDFVLIGFNFSSLAFAQQLARQGTSFCILDARHSGAIPTKIIPKFDGKIYTRVPFNSGAESTQSTSLNMANESFSLDEETPLSFEKGTFTSFLGFGDQKIGAIDAVAPYCLPNVLTSTIEPEVFWQQAYDDVKDHVFLDEEVTDLHWTDSFVTSITVNGKHKVQGLEFLFFDHLPFLFDKIGQEEKKLASQFAKAKWYSSVNLIIVHANQPKKVEMNKLYLLFGAKNQACIGQWTQNHDFWISRWESFFSAELTQDSETTGQCLKEIKKQLKRAFGEDLSPQDTEHIVIHDPAYADFSKMRVINGKLNYFKNLRAFPHGFGPEVGWIHQAHLGLQAFGDFFPDPAPPKNLSQSPNEVAAHDSPC